MSVASVVSAQEGVKSPRDASSGLLIATRIHASNSHAYPLVDITVSKYVLISRSGLATGRRQHSPIGWKMTLPPGAAPKSFSLGEMNSGGAAQASTDANFTYHNITWAMLTLELNGASCAAKVPARYDEGSKAVDIQLGDLAALFDTQRKPIAAKCNER